MGRRYYTMTLRKRAVCALGGCVIFWSGAGRAEEPEKVKKPEKPAIVDATEALDSGKTPAAATIDRIMEQAVRNIAARYNLNDVQAEETDKLMKREVYRFLIEHENEVWPIIRDLLKWQLQTPDDPEKMMDIGKAAGPLAKLAEEAIYRSNEEWGLILTPEQKRVHDFDLTEMRKTFEEIHQNFAEWEAGRPTEKGIVPDPQIAGRDPPRPPRPPKGRLPDPEVEIFDPNQIFETLVEEFIKEYGLDEGQITSARSILEEFKVKANDFREAKKVEFAKIALKQQEAMVDRDLDTIKKARADQKKLLRPVYELSAEMHDRLEKLLTTAQIQRHAERSKRADEKPKASKVTKKTSPKKSKPSEGESSESGSQAKSDKG